MQTSYRTTAASSVLLLAASAGLAASGGAAEASGTHHTSARAAKSLTVRITSTKSGVELSQTTLRPGRTLFKVVRGNTGGSMQLLRIRSGYSLKKASRDFGQAFGGNTRAVKRIDKYVVFYGGMPVPAKGAQPNLWGTNIDKAGKYYVLNLNRNLPPTAFRAKGAYQHRHLPAAEGWINMATGPGGSNQFKSPATDPHKGWIRTTNNAHEPHFVVLNKVKESTTKKDVNDFIANGNPNSNPPWALPFSRDTNVISPGHNFVWKLRARTGKYLVTCFWPSKTTGMPHFFMGMFKLLHLS
jgi:hypothetical protein